MNIIKHVKFGSLLAAVLLCAGTASAQGPVLDTAATTSNLAVSATFQTALQLDITTASGGVSVGGSAGAYTLAFGNVNGLGLGTPPATITRASVSGGFMYTTPITLTPSFTGFASTTASIGVAQNASDSAPSLVAAREGVDAGTMVVLPAPGSPTSISTTAASGTPIGRVIGVFVPTANTVNAAAGSRTMNLIYTISVP